MTTIALSPAARIVRSVEPTAASRVLARLRRVKAVLDGVAAGMESRPSTDVRAQYGALVPLSIR